jgi:hypothetical protein
MKIFKLIIVFYTALSTVVMAQENQVLYCSDNDKTGFGADENDEKYEPAPFRTLKYTVLLSDDNSFIELKDADNTERFVCSPLYNIGIKCNSNAYTFNLNTTTLHYTYAKLYGWLTGVNDTISVAYGTCAKF